MVDFPSAIKYLHGALESGVRGYVLKTQVVNDLVHAIRQVLRGGFYLSPGVSQAVVEAYRSKSERPSDPLSIPIECPQEGELLSP